MSWVIQDLLHTGYISPSFDSFFAFEIIWVIICAVAALISASSKNEERQREADKRYDKAREAYEKKVSEDAERVRKELAKKQVLQHEIDRLRADDSATRNLLAEAYSMDTIYPKYRTLPAVCTFLDYFKSGICTDFYGHDGAYARYEDDSRLERICTAVESIDSKMDIVIKNQYQLYVTVRQCGDQIRSLTSSVTELSNQAAESVGAISNHAALTSAQLDALLRTAEITAWSSQQTQKELAYRRRLESRNDYRTHL